ncbi:MAG: NADH-quinone oxidoreductase subunit J [Actinobacteria bacterium]|nr:NADH-quinone oxidoreductase subunit J [Actinomycetota bacterium]
MTGLLAVANGAAPISVAQNVGFGAIALLMVVGAWRCVTTSNVVHAALWLVLVLAGAAAQYVLMAAEFVAVTQVLVYVGAIVVLFLFGIMLTRSPIGGDAELSRANKASAAVTGLAMVALLGFTLVDTFGGDRLPADLAPTTASQVSDAVFSRYLLPFEAVSILLTAALVGAIVIARKE